MLVKVVVPKLATTAVVVKSSDEIVDGFDGDRRIVVSDDVSEIVLWACLLDKNSKVIVVVEATVCTTVVASALVAGTDVVDENIIVVVAELEIEANEIVVAADDDAQEVKSNVVEVETEVDGLVAILVADGSLHMSDGGDLDVNDENVSEAGGLKDKEWVAERRVAGLLARRLELLLLILAVLFHLMAATAAVAVLVIVMLGLLAFSELVLLSSLLLLKVVVEFLVCTISFLLNKNGISRSDCRSSISENFKKNYQK